MHTDRYILSHRWARRPEVSPAVLAAVEISGPYPKSLARMQARTWVVDYEFNSFGRVGVRFGKLAWCSRRAGSVHLYPPDREYCEDTRRERGQRHSAWLDFAGGEEAGLGPLVRQHGYARFLDQAGRVGDLLQQAAQAGHEQGEVGFWRAQASLCAILDLLLLARHVQEEAYCIAETAAPATAPGFMQQVRNFMKNRLSRTVTLEEVADAMHVSVSTLAHRYRRDAGETPKTTMLRLRIEQARMLLLRGNSVKAVAHQLGFSDACHLSKTFKRLEGLSPKEFVRGT